MSIKHTRALLNAALDGTLARWRFRQDPFFGLTIPEACRASRRCSTPARPGRTGGL